MVGKDDKEYIIEVNDCATTLFGESQEDDRKYIAELTLKSMEVSSSKDMTIIAQTSTRYRYLVYGGFQLLDLIITELL